METKHLNRESWLIAAGQLTAKLIEEAGQTVPKTAISVGFPKGGGKRVVGQCWAPELSVAGVSNIFVCPTLGDKSVVAVLLHEQIHAAVGCAQKHRGMFSSTAKKVGFFPRWTMSNPGPELQQKIDAIYAELGDYPHDVMNVPSRKTGNGSRYRLWECQCGIKVRTASDDFVATCGLCEAEFVQQLAEKKEGA